MTSVLALAWEVLPICRRTRVANGSVWIQLAVTSRDVERRITTFMSLANDLVFYNPEAASYETRVRFVRKRDAVHEVLFAVVQVKLA